MFIQTKETEIINVPELDMTNLITKVELFNEGDQHSIFITAAYSQSLPSGVPVNAYIKTIDFETKGLAEFAFMRISKVTCGRVAGVPYRNNPSMQWCNPNLTRFYSSHHPDCEQGNKKT